MENILEYLESNRLSELKNILNEENPVDIAEYFEDLSKEKTMLVFRILQKDTASEVFSYLSPEKQEEIIESITDEELKRILDELFLDDTVDLIEEMPANIVDKILKNSSPETRKLINQFLKYPENSAGGVMTVEYVSFKNDMTIGQALSYFKNVGMNKKIPTSVL